MRKITCIVGSPRINGSSNYLIDSLINKINRENIEVKNTVYLNVILKTAVGAKNAITTAYASMMTM